MEFYKLSIRTRHVEDDMEKLAIYINGLRYDIQYEISLLSLKTIGSAYQVAFKAEEKLLRKQSQNNRGKNPAKEEELPNQDSGTLRMKQEGPVINHQIKETFVEEYLDTEVEIEEGKFGVIHVEN